MRKRRRRDDCVSQLTSLESARQSIPPLSFRLAGPASMAQSVAGSTKLSTVLYYFYKSRQVNYKQKKQYKIIRASLMVMIGCSFPLGLIKYSGFCCNKQTRQRSFCSSSLFQLAQTEPLQFLSRSYCPF